MNAMYRELQITNLGEETRKNSVALYSHYLQRVRQPTVILLLLRRLILDALSATGAAQNSSQQNVNLKLWRIWSSYKACNHRSLSITIAFVRDLDYNKSIKKSVRKI